MLLISIVVLLLAALPVLMFLKNMALFLPAANLGDSPSSTCAIAVSVLIPARNEATSIRASLESVLRSQHPIFEVLVLDDHSEDDTARIVQSIADGDSRVRILQSDPLPTQWNGKQHACWQLANHARNEWLLFLDADVRLSKDAITRCLSEQTMRKAPLISGFPRQETMTLAEKLLIPLMHYVLLGYLPIGRMRATLGIGLAAGCGQLFLAHKPAYMVCGGHSAIRSSRHDGIQLPRTFRKAGFTTDIFDATDIASCRMYMGTSQVCNGLLKNATEGIANPKLILPFSILLIGGSVLPLIGLMISTFSGAPIRTGLLFGVASAISFVPRIIACKRFEQSILGALLHPLGISCFVALQWIALVRKKLGISTLWRGRQ